MSAAIATRAGPATGGAESQPRRAGLSFGAAPGLVNAPRFARSPQEERVAWALVATGCGAAVTGLWLAPDRTWASLLLDGFYVLSIALAGGLLLCIHYLSGAGWSSALRRVPEAMLASLPVLAGLVIAVFLGGHRLYPWWPSGEPGAIVRETLPPDKAAYLSPAFVLVRMLIVLGLWIVLGGRLRRLSLDEDVAVLRAAAQGAATSDHHRRLVGTAAAFTVVFALTFSLASLDWLMSLDPRWSSTIFAVYVFAGLLQLGFAVATLIVVALRATGPLRHIVHERHLHDLGQLLFGFSTFWAYIWLSQYLLIWYGNLPEEITHYLRRTGPDWQLLFAINLILNWVVPFLVLMPRWSKRSPRVLAGVAIVVLVGRWLDLYLLIMPQAVDAPVIGVRDLLIAAGHASLVFLLITRALARAPLVPIGDPFLEDSLRH